MKIGIYGGTFDPPHLGHMEAARTALEQMNLDRLIIIPDCEPPHKDLAEEAATPQQRLEMAALMADGLGPRAEVSDLEIRREGKSYTADTVEALHEGRFPVRSNGVVQLLHLPDFLRKELLAYAQRNGISSGPIFCTKSGKPLGRTAVTDSIKQLCRDARVSEEKANPRCLKRLWQSTQDGIRAQIDLLVEQACDRLMEAEQLTVGWDVGKGVSDV